MKVDSRLSRDLWHALEPINAVTYFCAEPRDAFSKLGCKGFWMGYFASRAAPMGPVSAGAVEASFFNFHPSRVRRAIPDAWRYVTPEEILEVRSVAAATALRRLLSTEGAETLGRKVQPSLDAAIAGAASGGKPLFGANRDVPRPADPVGALWQAATTLREHRGDCHVSLLTAAGLDGLQALVLFALSEQVDPALFMDGRGWSLEEWEMAIQSLTLRGLVTEDGTLSTSGHELREDIERLTDELSGAAYGVLDADTLDELIGNLRRGARLVTDSGEIPFPNPIGLPAPGK
jgi:hypothetical protein